MQLTHFPWATAAIVVVGAACATGDGVVRITEGIEVSSPLLGSEWERASALREELSDVRALVEDQAHAIDAAASLVELAQERASEAEEMLRRQLVPEVEFELSGLRFELGSSRLTAEAESLLDQLAQRLLAEGVGRFLEVRARGDSDQCRPGGFLAAQRAEEVRRHLHARHEIPLWRISAVADGCGDPEASRSPSAGEALVIVLSEAPSVTS